MSDQGYDLAIIGAGPGGYVAAIHAAQRGLKTALIEHREIGGVCLQAGCVPTKAMLASVDLLRAARAGAKLGVVIPSASATWADIASRRQKVVQQLTQGVRFLLEKNGVETIRGHGFLKSASEIEVRDEHGQVLRVIDQPRRMLLATGSHSTDLPCAPRDGVNILHSGDWLGLTDVEGDWIVIGGGYIGCEIAGILAPLGCRVTIIEALDRLLPNLDRELGKTLERSFNQAGIQCHFQARVAQVQTGNGVKVTLEDGRVFEARRALVSVGRAPNTENLGLENAGVTANRQGIPVDDFCCTQASNIYAIGDVTGKMALAHVASAQARLAVERIATELAPGGATQADARPIDYDAIPACVFTHPEIATVGLSEEEATKRGITTRAGRFPFAASGKALAAGETEGFVKWVADAPSGRLIGGHIIGSHASELIATMALGVRAGLTARQVADTVFAHPTLGESLHEAAEGIFGKPTHVFTRR